MGKRNGEKILNSDSQGPAEWSLSRLGPITSEESNVTKNGS